MKMAPVIGPCTEKCLISSLSGKYSFNLQFKCVLHIILFNSDANIWSTLDSMAYE